MTREFKRADLDRVAERLRGRIHRTPLMYSESLSDRFGRPIHLKCENLQKTGSFKVRGALHFMETHGEPLRTSSAVTVSAGNHAQAVSWAARSAGVRATVVMPESAPTAKVDASRGYGGDVRLHGTVFDAFTEALRLRDEEGMIFVHPFDDPSVLEGQATVMKEILEDLPDVESVVVPVGGGGLIAGMAMGARAYGSSVQLHGVEPTGADAMVRSLEAGRPVRLDTVDTIADGLGAPMAGDRTFPIIRDRVESVTTVEDDTIVEAMKLLLTRTKLLTEPGGAAGVAAFLAGAVELRGTGPAVVVLSGGNVDMDRIARWFGGV